MVSQIEGSIAPDSREKRPKGIFILDESAAQKIYGPEQRDSIAKRIDLVPHFQTASTVAGHPELLRDVEIIMSGWGMPLIDDAFLAHAPKLKAIFYGSGAVGGWMTEAVLRRGIVVTSAYAANADPVAKYTLGAILLSLKHCFRLSRETRAHQTFPPGEDAPGYVGSTIGLISLGIIARKLIELLRPFEFNVMLYDPFVSRIEAEGLGVTLAPLDAIFRQSDVVSLHTPLLEETVGMITGDHIAAMKQGATFINTARGSVVRENEMIDVLRGRTDLQAILDIAAKEPPDKDSPLYHLPNVFLTPHIAGSVGPECRRMGQCMVDELDRYLTNQPLKWAITSKLASNSSHRPYVSKTVKLKRVGTPVGQ